jgi:hypothetical protein
MCSGPSVGTALVGTCRVQEAKAGSSMVVVVALKQVWSKRSLFDLRLAQVIDEERLPQLSF